MRLLVTRPPEDAHRLKDRLEALGHAVTLAPLLAIVPRRDAAIPEGAWQAVAATSANAFRALPPGHGLASLLTLTVGPQSLAAARAAGFSLAEAHGGDVAGLAAHMRGRLDPGAGPILYLSGAATSGDLEGELTRAGFACRRLVLYDAAPAASLGEAEALLRDNRFDAVMLYSPRTARIWRSLAERHGLDPQAAGLLHLCLSDNVAAVLPSSWRRVVARTPDEEAMLALLEQSTRTH